MSELNNSDNCMCIRTALTQGKIPGSMISVTVIKYFLVPAVVGTSICGALHIFWYFYFGLPFNHHNILMRRAEFSRPFYTQENHLRDTKISKWQNSKPSF